MELKMDLMERLSRNVYPAGGNQCAGCGSHIAGSIISRALAKYDDVVAQGQSCGFGTIGRAGGGQRGAIMGMWGATLTGRIEAMKLQGITGKRLVEIRGDGSTVTMGLGTTLHAFMRQLPFTLMVMNNEYFAQSGYHLAGTSPLKASDKALMRGRYDGKQASDPVPLIVAAAGAKYTATATLAYPEDLIQKIEVALEHQPSYIQVLVPCEAGWRYPTAMTVEVTRLAVKTDLFPLWEWLNDSEAVYFKRTVRVEDRLPITEYTKHQRRFQHITEADVADLNDFIKRQAEVVDKLEMAYK